MAMNDPTWSMLGQAMLDGLLSHIRDNLRSKIMERVQPDMDAAVEAAISELKVRILSHQDYMGAHPVISVLIDGVKKQ